MSQVFLPTKLYMPSLKSRLVSRPRLLQKLDPTRERKLALVSAPAGFGKTTLLGDWLHQQGEADPPLPGTWLSLDSNDNDPARFTAYLVTALQRVEPDLGSEVLELLKAGQATSINGIWEYLVGEIGGVSSPFVLILDDYHVIENPIIHNCLAFLVEQMPVGMHLVILSRADPPLPLSRLRVRGELVELRALDLRFNSQEMSEFLSLWTGKQLSVSNQAELERRTEGWIAGLQLAVLAMQKVLETETEETQDTSLSDFIHRLSGSTRFILDYLAEEVLATQSEVVRSFLLKTCILERLTTPLCDALTDRQDSQDILAFLEKENLFLFPLDDERSWYRYHHLFADLLRNALQHQQPSIVPRLHLKASAWYESQGLVTEAIQHALKIPDPGEAARLMEKVALRMLMRGEVNTIQGWSSWIPDDEARQRPSLFVCFALAFLVSDKLEQTEHYLSLVSHAPSSPDLQAQVMATRSILAWCKGEYENAIQSDYQAVGQLSPEQTYLRGLLALSSGAAYEKMGEDEAALQSFQEAKQISHVFGNRVAEITTLKKLGYFQVRRGQLHQAALSYQQALQLGSIRDGQLLPVAAQTLCAISQLYYEWNQLEQAKRYLLQGVELSRKLENACVLVLHLQNLARICWIQGDRESALRLRRETEQIVHESPPVPVFADQIAFQQVRMYLQMGDTQAAVRWAQSYEQDLKSAHDFTVELMTLMWIRVYLAQENASKAIEALEQALPVAGAAGRWGVVIELLVLQALALAMGSQVPQALAALVEALRLAEPEGYTRIFLDEGEPMARLLRMVYRSKEKGARDYEARLLEGLLSAGPKAAPASPKPPGSRSVDDLLLIDPLSERELEVLRMIAEGHSNHEIAEKLFITLGTVKAHVSHIYSKLDVRSRTQAIVKADQLRLLGA